MNVTLYDKDQDVRHAARCTWPKIRDRTEKTHLCESLDLLGYRGGILSMSPEAIIKEWEKAGWVSISPSGFELRVTPRGMEQLAVWEDEDNVWETGLNEDIKIAKRLVANEPARNVRKIAHAIGKVTVTGIHDPYMRAKSLITLLKLAEAGTVFSTTLRILSTPIAKNTERSPLVSFLNDINTERSTTWEIRTYAQASKPHRRFLVLDDGSVVTCGMSLNHIDKDEVLDREPAGSENAKHDQQFFDNKWKIGTTVS